MSYVQTTDWTAWLIENASQITVYGVTSLELETNLREI